MISLTSLFSTILFLLLLNNLLLLGAPGIAPIIRLTAFQGMLLALLLLGMDHALLACAVFGIKGALLPGLLERTRRRLTPSDKPRPRLHLGAAVFTGILGLVFSLWLETRLPILPNLFPPLLLPTALTTLFCGLILVVGRVSAISQVIGYLVAENGIFLLGVPLMAAGAIWFELALLLDIFVAVFVMGNAIGHIGETFDSIDTGRFRSLRD
ncbi:hydrogenase-4 component E [uncultured Desulfovibrio sp.]|uniref:hydrogenase-4 component E n=1 Tax=uncultured Desulfovibrio sp. TaxID=167968 RepID=UPI00280568CE|nr:hydrogenase-4 component E [uncultured Desulfovibrio sp.]